MCYFSLTDFNILSLFLIVPIYLQCVSVVFFGLAIFGILCSFELDACFLYQVRKVFCYYVFKNVLCPFHSLLFFRDPPITRILVQLIFSRRLLKLFSFLKNYLAFYWKCPLYILDSSSFIRYMICNYVLALFSLPW